MYAAVLDNTEVIRVLVENGANLESVDNNGLTALHFAARVNREGATKVLCELGSDKRAKTLKGHTPLKCASQKKFARVIRILTE